MRLLVQIRACLINILKKKPARGAEKKTLPKFTNILKYLFMNLRQQMKKISKNDLFRKVFFKKKKKRYYFYNIVFRIFPTI